jgi:SHS2 domain-containing protein
MTRPFRFLEHTADIGFEALGRTREEVFANAARALMQLVADTETLRMREAAEIRVEGSTPPDLLVNWLGEILYLHETERLLFRDFEIHRLDERSLNATARGEKFDPARHRIKLQIKAVTYHQLGIEETADGWRAQVYVDI